MRFQAKRTKWHPITVKQHLFLFEMVVQKLYFFCLHFTWCSEMPDRNFQSIHS